MNTIIRKLKENQELTTEERTKLVAFLSGLYLEDEIRKGQFNQDARERMQMGGGACPACGK